MKKIKPIQTRYKGYYFRSRLEARWAVFFDSLNIKWEYEKEGYHFKDGTNYLPDFWLPQVNMWAEVKGQDFSKEEIKKVKNLTRETGYPVLMLIKIPENKPYNTMEISEGIMTSYINYVISNYHNYPLDEGRFYCLPGEDIAEFPRIFPDTEKAVNKAKEARFEFDGK